MNALCSGAPARWRSHRFLRLLKPGPKLMIQFSRLLYASVAFEAMSIQNGPHFPIIINRRFACDSCTRKARCKEDEGREWDANEHSSGFSKLG